MVRFRNRRCLFFVVCWKSYGISAWKTIITQTRYEGGSGTQIITNKFPNDIQQGKTFNYTIENGKIKIENGIQEVDFVIDMDGNLHIGRSHSYLAGGNPVQAAGQLKVNAQGYIRLIVNDSGHYQPSVTEALNYPE